MQRTKWSVVLVRQPHPRDIGFERQHEIHNPCLPIECAGDRELYLIGLEDNQPIGGETAMETERPLDAGPPGAVIEIRYPDEQRGLVVERGETVVHEAVT